MIPVYVNRDHYSDAERALWPALGIVGGYDCQNIGENAATDTAWTPAGLTTWISKHPLDIPCMIDVLEPGMTFLRNGPWPQGGLDAQQARDKHSRLIQTYTSLAMALRAAKPQAPLGFYEFIDKPGSTTFPMSWQYATAYEHCGPLMERVQMLMPSMYGTVASSGTKYAQCIELMRRLGKLIVPIVVIWDEPNRSIRPEQDVFDLLRFLREQGVDGVWLWKEPYWLLDYFSNRSSAPPYGYLRTGGDNDKWRLCGQQLTERHAPELYAAIWSLDSEGTLHQDAPRQAACREVAMRVNAHWHPIIRAGLR